MITSSDRLSTPPARPDHCEGPGGGNTSIGRVYSCIDRASPPLFKMIGPRQERESLSVSSSTRLLEGVGTSAGGTATTTSTMPALAFTSPARAKKISQTNQQPKRRVIFPFLPKVAPTDTTTTTTTTSTMSPVSPRTSTVAVKPLSPVGATSPADIGRVSTPALPFLVPGGSAALVVEPQLLPRESSLSSQEDATPTSPDRAKTIVTFEDNILSSSSNKYCPPSILKSPRSTRWNKARSLQVVENNASSSVESDLPSLGGTSSESDSCDEKRRLFPRYDTTSSPRRTNTVTSSDGRVTFDPRIWVREFARAPEEQAHTWYTTQELEQFKLAAMERIMAYSEQPIATGTGRVVPSKRCILKDKALFSHKALGTGNDVRKEALFRAVLQNELRRVLIVDCHDVFLRLFSKTLSPLLPHADIVLAHNAAMALEEAGKGRFDLIIVEERLNHHPRNDRLPRPSNTNTCTTQPVKGSVPSEQESCSGTALIARLKKTHGRALFIAVSTKFREDLPRMQTEADMSWPKPPPLNTNLVRDLLYRLLVKRHRSQAIESIF